MEASVTSETGAGIIESRLSRRLCTKGEFVLVAVDEDGGTIPID
jgi:hypothetical protein